jgi:hypothetical protein
MRLPDFFKSLPLVLAMTVGLSPNVLSAGPDDSAPEPPVKGFTWGWGYSDAEMVKVVGGALGEHSGAIAFSLNPTNGAMTIAETPTPRGEERDAEAPDAQGAPPQARLMHLTEAELARWQQAIQTADRDRVIGRPGSGARTVEAEFEDAGDTLHARAAVAAPPDHVAVLVSWTYDPDAEMALVIFVGAFYTATHTESRPIVVRKELKLAGVRDVNRLVLLSKFFDVPPGTLKNNLSGALAILARGGWKLMTREDAAAPTAERRNR